MEIWCDASFDDKKKVGGIGIIIKEDGRLKKPISFWIKAPDVNYVELYAIYISSILSGGNDVTIYSDSQTAVDYVQNRRNKTYEEKNKKKWTRAQYIKHQNMKVLAYKINKVSDKIKVVKTKAHTRDYNNDHLNNNLADILSRIGRSKFYDR